MLATRLETSPTITTFFPGSQTKSFDLESFYFGCAVMLGQGAAAVPSACNIQVTGYQGRDNSVSNAKQICSRQFQYNPTTALGTVQQAFSGNIRGCKDLSFAIVTFSPEGGAAATSPLLAIVLDDIKYSTCSK
ncbi:hypothetical protein CERZMDRAFT_99413 [Cercospora zeae-maydis SCOH1-5]|uniref:Uncharacterized protein n=1 Tax=Cercospora zeae-maydis SCOH1-5 TaxID=717836 RepID=A0A6A6FAC2_9PEZI|nr:hypothetical protein CERZMDRAFT_99413 [Cercospora zeae-maydis SCOH1-5]